MRKAIAAIQARLALERLAYISLGPCLVMQAQKILSFSWHLQNSLHLVHWRTLKSHAFHIAKFPCHCNRGVINSSIESMNTSLRAQNGMYCFCLLMFMSCRLLFGLERRRSSLLSRTAFGRFPCPAFREEFVTQPAEPPRILNTTLLDANTLDCACFIVIPHPALHHFGIRKVSHPSGKKHKVTLPANSKCRLIFQVAQMYWKPWVRVSDFVVCLQPAAAQATMTCSVERLLH